MTEAELAERIKRLERDNRRIKRLALAAFILVSALIFLYAERPVPQTLTARELDIRDSHGNLRIMLDTKSNEPGITFYDAQGNPREVMYVGADGSPDIAFYDVQGKPRAMIRTDAEGSPDIAFFDSQGKPRAGMGVDANGSPEITLSDAQGNPRAVMYVYADGSPAFGLADAQGKPRAGMAVAADGSPRISLSDAQGFSMDLGSSGTVIPQTGETRQTSAASIVMFGNDKNHHVIWQAP